MKRSLLKTTLRRITASLLLLSISGCTTLPADLGRSDVDAMVRDRGQPVDTGTSEDGESLVEALTRQPLNADRAVRIALVNNPKLQASYAQLGFAAADIYAAGRIRNPVFSASILDSSRAGERDQVAFGLVASFTDLLTLGARTRLASAEFARMKQSIGAAVLDVAAEAEAAYYRYVAARQVAALRAQVATAGRLSAELAGRYHQAGNLSARELALERAAAAEAQLLALQAEAATHRRRAQLAGVLGLAVAGPWEAPTGLPLPPQQEAPISSLLELATQSRLDLAAARAQADIVADRLGVTGWTRWLGELDVGAERERDTDGARLRGPSVSWELPIFTRHRDELMRVEAELQIAIADVQRLSMAVGNSVRLAYATTENARARVDVYRTQLVPARKAAVQRAQEEENFMLIGVFELLQEKQQEYDAYQGYFEAVRDYWLSRVELARAVGNSLPGSAPGEEQMLEVDVYLLPPAIDRHAGHGPTDGDAGRQPHDHSRHGQDATPLEETPVSPDQDAVPPATHQRHVHPHDADGGSQ